MQSSIMIPLDGSPTAERVIPSAAALARATDSAVLLLRVVAPTPIALQVGQSVPLARYSPATLTQSQETALAERYLQRQARQLIAEGLIARSEVCVQSDPAAAILARARRESRLKLIAMGSHGRSGLEQLVLGSVTERVLRHAPCPLLVDHARLAPPAALRYRTIVVPLDRTPFSEQALLYARTLALTTGAALVLVAVTPSTDDMGLAEAGLEPMWMLAECQDVQEQVTSYLGRKARQLAARGIQVRTRLMNGLPSDGILQTCAEERADLVVMATHGRRGLRRMLLGSVASSVIAAAASPVLLVRPGSRAAHW